MPFSPTLAKVVLSTPRRKVLAQDPEDTRLPLPPLSLAMLTKVQQQNRFFRQYRRIRHHVGVEIGAITRSFDKRTHHKQKPNRVPVFQRCHDLAVARAVTEAHAAQTMTEMCDAIEKRIESGAPSRPPVFQIRKTSMGYVEELVPEIAVSTPGVMDAVHAEQP